MTGGLFGNIVQCVNNSVIEHDRGQTADMDLLLDEFDALMFRFARVIGSHAIGDEALTPPQYMVLRALDRAGAMRVSDVASYLGVTNPAASMLLHEMTEEELVCRESDPKDRRATLLSVSEKGAVAIALAEEVRRGFVKRITSRLSTEELRTMIHGLNELADAIAEED